MPAHRKKNQSRRLTAAGLIAVTAATLLMMAWVIFPTAAFAFDGKISWMNSQGFVEDCPNGGLWNFLGSDNVTSAELHVGNEVIQMSDQGNHWRGTSTGLITAGTDAFVNYFGTVDANAHLVLSHCEGLDEAPDLDITKTASTTQVNEGGAFSYTITVENTGDASATNVVVTDNLDNNLTGVSVSPSQGTCDPVGVGNTIECHLGTLAAGGSATVTIAATAPQLPLTEGGVCEISIANTASVDSGETDEVSDEAPPVTVTGTGCDEAPDLDITKTASTTQVNEGGAFSYTITVENTGDASATNVVVTDNLDNNLTGVSVSPSQGTCDPVGVGNTIECHLGTLAAGGSATVTIAATAPQLPLTEGGVCEISIANTASVDSGETDEVSDEAPPVTVTGTGCDEAPDLDITKTASTTQVNEGGAFSYTITVENTGDASATNVVVTDNLDNNLTGVSVSPSQGTCDPVGVGNTIECHLGTLAAGGSATVTIAATAPQLPLTEGGVCEISIANTASVDSGQTDEVSDEAPPVTVTGTGCETTTTTTTPGGGGGVAPTSTTTTTTPPTAAPTTIHKSTTTTDEVLPTTVTPGGTAFTGVENVVPIGAIALMLMTSGSGLLWAGSRRRRHDGSEDED